MAVAWTAPYAAPAGGAAATGAGAGDLTNTNTYWYRVAALAGGTYTSTRPGVPCAEFSAVADANGSIDLSWNTVAGCSGYIVWRSPTSGLWTLNYNADGNLSKDTHMMALRANGAYHNTMRTVVGAATVTYTDTGTASERTSSHAYYKIFHNYPCNNDGIGYIIVSGYTIGTPGTLDDIYNTAVGAGWTANFNLLYSNGGYRVFECKAYLDIRDYFTDNRFTLILHHHLDCEAGAQLRQFGEYLSDNTTISACEFVTYNPCGRSMNHTLRFNYSALYGVKFLIDFGVTYPKDIGLGVPIEYSDSGSILFRESTIIKNVVIDDATQYVYAGDGNIDIDTLDLFRNFRGLNLESDLVSPSFVNIRSDNFSDDSFMTGASVTLTFIGCTFYNSAANIHRFWTGDDSIRVFQDCVFPNGHGFPSSGRSGNGSTGCICRLDWSLDIKLLDEDKNGIQATNCIVITDKDGTAVTGTTDANGDMTVTQVLKQAEYSKASGTGTFDTTTTYNPYKIEINVNGYQPYFGPLDLEKTEALTITLKKQICNSMHKTVMLMRG